MNTQKRVAQSVSPRGFAGRVTLILMNMGHRSIYENVARVLEPRPEDDVLEVACGNGYFLRRYASCVHSIAGLDLSEIAVKSAIRKNRERIAAGTAEFLRGEASRLPWAGSKFSAATCMASFALFPRPLDSLKEVRRVLRPSGRAVISVEWNAEDGRDHSREIAKYGYQIWSEAEVRHLFEDAGFWHVSITYARGLMMPKMMIARAVKQ